MLPIACALGKSCFVVHPDNANKQAYLISVVGNPSMHFFAGTGAWGRDYACDCLSP